MSDITINYKGTSIATMDASGTKTLLTSGKYCEDDIEVVYVSPGGGGGIDINDVLSGTAPSGDVTLTISSVSMPFQNNSAITKITAPDLTTVPGSFFRNMSNLEYIVTPSCTKIEGAGMSYNSNLLGIDWLGGTGTSAISSLSFAQNSKLATVVMRQTGGIVPCTQTNAFTGSKSADKPIHIYVPTALKSTYESATNWTTWVNDGTIVFHAIEGSTYATHYVDGTTI